MTRSIWLGFVLLTLSWGCNGGQGMEEEPSPGHTARFGLIAVNYGHDWAESGEGMLLTTNAQFVRYTAMNQDQVARLLALPIDPDRDLPSVERCKVYDLSGDLSADVAKDPEEQGNVELLEAGDLQIQTQGRTVTLAPKHFPGLLPFISGVVYSEAQATLVDQAEKVQAHCQGGESVGAFTAQVTSPVLPRLERVGHQEPADRMTLAKDRDLALRWQVPPEGSSDVLYLELRYSSGKRDMALRCRPKDSGSFSIPQAMLSEVSGKAVLEVARLRRTFFSVSGLDRGELRVTVRDSAPLQ
jgi:hypothetical protein